MLTQTVLTNTLYKVECDEVQISRLPSGVYKIVCFKDGEPFMTYEVTSTIVIDSSGDSAKSQLQIRNVTPNSDDIPI